MREAIDTELQTVIARGDAVGTAAHLYDRHGAAVWHAALAALGDRAGAEEVTVRVFTWATRHAARLAAAQRSPLEILLMEGHRVRLDMARVDMARAAAATEPVKPDETRERDQVYAGGSFGGSSKPIRATSTAADAC